jgi:pimeloyl-ACP methyl ester carboxylesterase
MGGMVATRFALMYPQLIEKFILENPIGLEDWKIKVPYQSVDIWYQTELKQDYHSFKKYEQESYYHGDWQPSADSVDHWSVGQDCPREKSGECRSEKNIGQLSGIREIDARKNKRITAY